MIEDYDELQLLRGKGIELNESTTILHPTLSDIEEIGVEKYSTYISILGSNVKDYADILWCEANVWYEDITSDWNFFVEKEMLSGYQGEIYIEDENYQTQALFVNKNTRDALNFFLQKSGEYVFVSKNVSEEITQTYLYNAVYDNNQIIVKEDCFKLNEAYYYILNKFITKINWISKNYTFLKGGTKGAKKAILRNDYNKRKRNVKQHFSFASIVSSLIAQIGNCHDIWDYPIYTLYDQYHRYNKIEEFHNTMMAYANGNIDTEKNPIDWDKINWASVIAH